jgi:uncharacterized protein with HEPN domain
LPSRTIRHHLEDILTSIGHAQEFVAGIGFTQYVTDRKTKSAVERELQIIAEASIRLGKDAEILCPGPDWIGFRGMGNVLRHGYRNIDDQTIWDTVHDELPEMQSVAMKALSKL